MLLFEEVFELLWASRLVIRFAQKMCKRSVRFYQSWYRCTVKKLSWRKMFLFLRIHVLGTVLNPCFNIDTRKIILYLLVSNESSCSKTLTVRCIQTQVHICVSEHKHGACLQILLSGGITFLRTGNCDKVLAWHKNVLYLWLILIYCEFLIKFGPFYYNNNHVSKKAFKTHDNKLFVTV